MRRPPRIVQAVVLTVAVGLSLAACDDKDAAKPAGPGAAMTKAPAASKALSQSHFSERVFSALEKAGSAKVHFETSAGGKKVGGDGEIRYGDELAVKMSMTPPGQTSTAP